MTISYMPKRTVPITPGMHTMSDLENVDMSEVQAKALQIKRFGVLTDPMVWDKTGEIISGKLTMYALSYLGRTTMTVLPVVGSEEEIKSMMATVGDGGFDQEAAYLETIRLYQEADNRTWGSQRRALERYAQEHGVPYSKAKERFNRSSRRLRHKRYMKAERYKTIPLRHNDAAAPDHDYLVELYALLDTYKQAEHHLLKAKRAVESIITKNMPVSRYLLATFLERIDKALLSVDTCKPREICTNCNAEPEVRINCSVCGGTGYLVKND